MAVAPDPPPAAPARPKGGRLRLVLWLVALLGIGGVGYLGLAHLSGGAYPIPPGLELGGDRGWLRRTTHSFWEDIQFKDFERAALYHAPDKQSSVDIPYLLERLFMVKPEALDIMGYEIVFVDVDSTGLRARVRCRIKVNELVRDKIDERDIVLYFHRETPSSPWYMELESSLRALEADDEKKH